MDSSEEELGQVLAIGEHCSVGHCGQIDFLPFKCDCCNRTFCLEHRSYKAHACPNAGAKETTVIVCPICAKSIHLQHGQEPNEAFDVHQRTGCDPSNYDRVHKKPRCPVGGCKEKLTTINAYRCKHCSQRVCLRHRDPGDHGCAEAQAALRQQRATGVGGSSKPSSGRATGGTNSAASSRPPSAPRAATGAAGAAGSAAAGRAAGALPPKRLDAQQLHAAAVQQYNDPANSLRGTAARRQQLAHQAAEQQRQQQQQSSFQWPWQQRQQEPAPPPPPPSQAPTAAPPRQSAGGASTNANRSSGSNANPLVPPHLPEECPQCGAKFATVERLIKHVEDFHPSSPPTGGSTAAPRPASNPGTVITNPLQGLLSAVTIAGGAAPAAAVPGPGYPHSGAVPGGGTGDGGGGGGGTREVFRCYHCSQTFNDPVLLVQHADRCAAAPGTARGRGRGAGGGASSSSGGGSSSKDKDNCVVC